jgi:dihydropteroate synthase
MGILNITPDSFSDGGVYASTQAACDRGVEMAGLGADIIDVGGESTRPGARPVSCDEQCERVLPVIERLRTSLPSAVHISIDTRSSVVARRALASGAGIINDIGAGRDDPQIFTVAAESGALLVLMHMQGTPETMQDRPYYDDVLREVHEFLMQRVAAAESAGVSREQIILDPGIGFGKRSRDNLRLLANLEHFVATGFPILLGTSRKRFMGDICRTSDPHQLGTASAVTTGLGVLAGVQIFRVHDVEENRQAADIARAVLANR